MASRSSPMTDIAPVRPKPDNIISFRERSKAVDGVSCRQIFLRSYTFSRKDSFRKRAKIGHLSRPVVAIFHRVKTVSSPKVAEKLLVSVAGKAKKEGRRFVDIFRRFLPRSVKV